MSAMKLLPLGVGDAFSARHYSSCVALESGGEWLLVDCPHPIRKMLSEASTKANHPLDVGELRGVALTHLHADHSSGLESLAYLARFVFRRRLPLIAAPMVVERLWAGHLAAGMEKLLPSVDAAPDDMRFEDYFEWIPLEPGHSVDFGAFRLEARPTIHHIPTTAFRIHAGGRTLGYSADTTFDPQLIAWLSSADLIVHETNYGVHTPYEKLAALPADLRARMRLIHYPDEYAEMETCIEKLREGELLNV